MIKPGYTDDTNTRQGWVLPGCGISRVVLVPSFRAPTEVGNLLHRFRILWRFERSSSVRYRSNGWSPRR